VAETDSETAAPEEPSGEPTVDNLDDRLDRVESTMAEVLAFLKGGGQPKAGEPEAPDIKRQVREAVREVQKADGEKAAKAEEEQSIKDQIGELRAALERKPREHKRATRRMGWVLESDQ